MAWGGEAGRVQLNVITTVRLLQMSQGKERVPGDISFLCRGAQIW